jgi:hypothetical protein
LRTFVGGCGPSAKNISDSAPSAPLTVALKIPKVGRSG